MMKDKIIKKVRNYRANKGKFIYVHARRNKKIEKNVVLLEAVHGDTVSGHIYYLLKDIIEKGMASKVYVSLKSMDDIEAFIPNSIKAHVQFVDHMSHQYYELLATSEYLINDTTFYPFFNKRREQKYYMIWHGTPLKHMGRDLPKVTEISNVQRNFYMADRIYVNNQKTMDIISEKYHLKNVYTGEFVIGPSPRNSVFFDDSSRNEIRKELNIEDKKVLVYMPTWRGNIGNVKSSAHVMQLINDLETKLNDDTVVYVKLHPFEKVKIPESSEKVRPFPKGYETYAFLNATDGLITDYSSVMYDYANLNRPIILYTYDLDEYIQDRGIYDDVSTYPFENVDNMESLLNAINQMPNQVNYKAFNQMYSEYDQLTGSEIILKHMLRDEKHQAIEIHRVHNGKETAVIVSGGFWNNGITTALINTLENIDTSERNYICYFEQDKVKPEHYYRLLNLPENVHFYPTTGEINGDFQDRLLMKQYLWHENINFKGLDKRLSRIFKEEFERLFGKVKVDWFIHYTGFERKSAEMMRHLDCKKAIWVHTDMFQEYEAKKNFSKKIIFNAYKSADKIVLVHENLREKLIKQLPMIKDKVVTINNFLGDHRTRKLSKENLFTTLSAVNVDYSYNETMELKYNDLSEEKLKDISLEKYPEQTALKEDLIKTINVFDNDVIKDYKPYLIDNIEKSHNTLYENFVLDKELKTTFKYLFDNQNNLLFEYFNEVGKQPVIPSVEFYENMRKSKCKMLDMIFNPNIKVYINIGRYDYQKGHDKLIKAFETVYKEDSNIFLIMVCPHGPLKSDTIQWVRDSIARDNIIILGGINNPYPLLKAADAFVFSSNYEGLGLVVYEALSLDTDVITVNLKETTEYLEDNQAIIVENNIQGLIEGFKSHLNNEHSFAKFDFDYYKEKSKTEFQNAIK